MAGPQAAAAAIKAPPAPKDFVTVTDGVISFTNPGGAYTIDFLNNGSIKVFYDKGAYVAKDPVGFDAASFQSVNVTVLTPDQINLVNVGFQEADATHTFEPTVDLNALIEKTLNVTSDPHWADKIDDFVAKFDVNGGNGDVIKLLWDYLDDNYVQLNNYYNNSVNEAFVRLGVEYVKYLNAGGAPLTDITAKFAADSPADIDLIAQRAQSMHDNLLGNVTDYSITQRNFPPDVEAALKALVADAGGGYLDRIDASGFGAFSGNQGDLGGAAHDQARAFDWDKGFERDDWLDTSFNGVVDQQAQDPAAPGTMNYGAGNPADDFNIVRHEGAQIELGLKVKHRGGDEYDEDSNSKSVTQTGISADYHVKTGTAAGSSTRAEWSFDWSATNFGDEDVQFRLLVDSDPTSGVNLVDRTLEAQFSAAGDGGGEFQNSWNVGFDFLKPGGYAFGAGDFTIRLEAIEDGQVIAYNQVVVHVDPLVP